MQEEIYGGSLIDYGENEEENESPCSEYYNQHESKSNLTNQLKNYPGSNNTLMTYIPSNEKGHNSKHKQSTSSFYLENDIDTSAKRYINADEGQDRNWRNLLTPYK